MRRLLLVMATLLLSVVIGEAEEKSLVQAMVQAAPEKIKKAALAMFVPQGYSIDLDTASQLKVSRTWSSEETNTYNTDHWTLQPVSNCRNVRTLVLLPGDHATSVTMHWDSVCHVDGGWKIWHRDDEKDVKVMQSTLADLKDKIEAPDQRH